MQSFSDKTNATKNKPSWFPSCHLWIGCNKRRASLAECVVITTTIRFTQLENFYLVDWGLRWKQPKGLLSYCCNPASAKPACKPWSEPWSEASVVVLPRWFVALVLTSLALVTLTSLEVNRSNYWHTGFACSNRQNHLLSHGSAVMCSILMKLARVNIQKMNEQYPVVPPDNGALFEFVCKILARPPIHQDLLITTTWGLEWRAFRVWQHIESPYFRDNWVPASG